MSLKPLKLVMSYDILCPHSWVAYQALQKKLRNWRTFRSLEVEYKPAMHPLIHRMAYGVRPAGLITPKKKYMENELNEICDFYGIKKGNFDLNFKHMEQRSVSSLALLIKFKKDLPDYYERMMCAMWEEFWHRSGSVNRVTQFLRLGRELGIPFRIMDQTVLHLEARENVNELHSYTAHLIDEERILSCPWFILQSVADEEEEEEEKGGEERKILAFGEILRFEMLDELLALRDDELARLAPVAEEEEDVYTEEDAEADAMLQPLEGDKPLLYENTTEANRLRPV